MRAINHALTGAVIGLVVTEPVLALPLAVLSHYVCDIIPHHGTPNTYPHKSESLRSKWFEYSLYIDALLCFGLVVILAFSGLRAWLLVSICAFLAAAPDLLSINHYIKVRQHKQWKPGIYTSFAGKIQWFERPVGLAVEVAWAIGMIVILTPFLK
jgi:hypothetical protein